MRFLAPQAVGHSRCYAHIMGAATNPGLCLDCQYSRRTESDRGSLFWQCQRSFTDPSFPKYPRLPVQECRGYERTAESDTDATHSPRP